MICKIIDNNIWPVWDNLEPGEKQKGDPGYSHH